MAKFDSRTFTNIDKEDFVGMWGGEEYLIKAGETKAFPSFLVDHFAKHLVDKMLLRDGVANYTNPALREPLLAKIKGEVVIPAEKEEEKTEGEIVKEEAKKIEEEFSGLEKKKEDEIRAKRLAALAKARAAKKAKAAKK